MCPLIVDQPSLNDWTILMPQASTCSTMGLESQHGNQQDPRIPGFSLAEILWNKIFWLADWWLMLSLIGSLPSSSMRSSSALWPPLWSWPAADVVIWSGCHVKGKALDQNIARIANAVQVTLLSLSLSLPLSLKGLPKVSKKSPKSLSKVSLKSLKSLSKVSQKPL